MTKLWWVCLLTACGGGGDSGPRPTTFGGDRPVDIKVPPAFDDAKDYPLIIGLHGYTSNGFVHANYFGLTKLVADDEALLLAPDGTTDHGGAQFWNADPVCCDFDKTNVDDVGYIGKLIDDVIATYPVDRSRVFVIGHSNGSFMAYRMACERPDVITAIAGLAGAASSVPASCTPEKSVSVLHIHGTADAMVPYTGGATGGAEGSVQQWGMHDGCGTALTATGTFDLEAGLAGNETQASALGGCPSGVAVALWKVEGGSHIPSWGPTFTPTLWQWLTDHPRK